MYKGFLAAAAAGGIGGGVSTRSVQPPGYSMDCEYAQLSDLGRVRQGNEDYLGYFAPATPEEARGRGYLFAVADGVGGQDLGEVASHTAVESVLELASETFPIV